MKHFVLFWTAILIFNANAVALQKSHEIIEKVIIAAGGAEAFSQLDNFRIKTESKIFGQQSTIQLVVAETVKFPDKTKQIFELAAGERIQTLDGNLGWKKSGDTISDLSETEKREMRRGLFRDTVNFLKNYEVKKITTEYFGEEVSGEDTLFVIHIKNSSGEFFNLYVNAKTNLIAKKSYQGGPEAMLATLQEIYSDYREVDGIKIPFKTVVLANGRKFIESRVVEAVFNVELSDDFFMK